MWSFMNLTFSFAIVSFFLKYNESTFYSMYMRFLHECVDVPNSWHQK